MALQFVCQVDIDIGQVGAGRDGCVFWCQLGLRDIEVLALSSQCFHILADKLVSQ